jgi:hypothetical protein
MPRVGFEPTIPVFERAKMVHALDRAAAVIGTFTFTFTFTYTLSFHLYTGLSKTQLHKYE